jgi:hypothetical protein
MKKLLLTALLGTTAFTATAGGYDPTGRSFSDSNAVSSSNSYSTNTNVTSPTTNSRSVSKVLNGADLSSKHRSKQSNSQDVTVSETTKIKPSAPTITAPNLVTGVCLGSASGGLSTPAGGLTFGSTTVDTECQIRYNSIRLEQLGMEDAAIVIMCQVESAREALELSGYACPNKKDPWANYGSKSGYNAPAKPKY